MVSLFCAMTTTKMKKKKGKHRIYGRSITCMISCIVVFILTFINIYNSTTRNTTSSSTVTTTMMILRENQRQDPTQIVMKPIHHHHPNTTNSDNITINPSDLLDWNNHNNHDTDICIIARAMSEQHHSTAITMKAFYPLEPVMIPNRHYQHVSYYLCRQQQQQEQRQRQSAERYNDEEIATKQQQHSSSSTSTTTTMQIIFGFKSARSGSTYFTHTLTKLIQQQQQQLQLQPAQRLMNNLSQQHSHHHHPTSAPYDNYQTSFVWEPYCRTRCKSPTMKVKQQQYVLNQLMTQNCQPSQPSKYNHCKPNQYCQPWGLWNHSNNNNNNTVTGNRRTVTMISAANPRYFSPALNWNKVLLPRNNTEGSDSHVNVQVKLFIIRRTNLVLMAYSKFHHPTKCNIGPTNLNATTTTTTEDEDDNHNEEDQTMFTIDWLLKCGEHYSFGNQELTSSVAYHAAAATTTTTTMPPPSSSKAERGEAAGGTEAVAKSNDVDAIEEPFLVLYEDVLSNPKLVQEDLINYLFGDDDNDYRPEDGETKKRTMLSDMMLFDSSPQSQSQKPGINITSTKNSNQKKIHSKPFCDNEDVDCATLKAGLKSSYPCLYKQLLMEETRKRQIQESSAPNTASSKSSTTTEAAATVWSAPILLDGTLSIHGDCMPLKPMTNSEAELPEQSLHNSNKRRRQGHRRRRTIEELYQMPSG